MYNELELWTAVTSTTIETVNDVRKINYYNAILKNYIQLIVYEKIKISLKIKDFNKNE